MTAAKDKTESVQPSNELPTETDKTEPVARGLFSYSRELRVPASDGKQSAFMSVSFPIYWDDDAESIMVKAKDAAFEAKANVFQQLQLDFTVEEGVAVEVVKAAFDGTTGNTGYPTGQTTGYSAPPTGASGSSMPPFPADSQIPAEKDANQQWARERFAQYPGEFWDNRQNKRNPRAPDAKHKSTNMPLWRVNG